MEKYEMLTGMTSFNFKNLSLKIQFQNYTIKKFWRFSVIILKERLLLQSFFLLYEPVLTGRQQPRKKHKNVPLT